MPFIHVVAGFYGGVSVAQFDTVFGIHFYVVKIPLAVKRHQAEDTSTYLGWLTFRQIYHDCHSYD